MNTNMVGKDGFQKSLHPCALDESRLSIVGVNQTVLSTLFYTGGGQRIIGLAHCR